jgi:hypothetical protein
MHEGSQRLRSSKSIPSTVAIIAAVDTLASVPTVCVCACACACVFGLVLCTWTCTDRKLRGGRAAVAVRVHLAVDQHPLGHPRQRALPAVFGRLWASLRRERPAELEVLFDDCRVGRLRKREAIRARAQHARPQRRAEDQHLKASPRPPAPHSRADFIPTRAHKWVISVIVVNKQCLVT